MATKKTVEEAVKKSVFETLSSINVNDKVEKKNGLTYLSWAWAWGKVKTLYPDASYKVIETQNEKGVTLPYIYDEVLGYLVRTEVTIEGDTIPMQLPVMDGANKAQKATSYKYKTKFGEKEVEGATMFDINTAIMRCLTKNLAMHGLGFYIYAGEDLPEERLIPNDSGKATTTQTKAPVTTPSQKEKLVKGTTLWEQVVTALTNKSRNISQVLAKYSVEETLLTELKGIK